MRELIVDERGRERRVEEKEAGKGSTGRSFESYSS